MPLKDLLTLVNIRKDWRFFIHRFIIGLILVFTISYTKKVDITAIVSDVDEKRAILIVFLLIMMLPMSIMYKTAPKYQFFKQAQTEAVLFCQTVTSAVRSMVIILLSFVLYSTFFGYEPVLAFMNYVYFLLALEITTRVHFGLKDFEYDNPEQFKGIVFVVKKN